MKKNKFFNGLKELYTGKGIYSKLMIVITICISLSTIFLSINNGNEIKNYIQSVIDGDPNYKKLKEKVGVFAYRKTINLNEFAEGINENDSEVVKGPITASNIKGGFDEYTPQQIVQEDSDSNNTNNSTSSNGNSSINDNNINNSNNSNNISNNDYVDNNVNKKDENQEILIDKSSFIGKDIIILEGSSFNAMKNLQLSATDVDGKNITDKIVITENNVDIYKPGLYTVKANVQLSNNAKLEKDFLVRVEPTILQLVVDDIQLSKEVVEKNEVYTMSFNATSSKDYLQIVSANINGADYPVNKTSERNLLKKYDDYKVELVATNRAGVEELNFNSITMSDGTVVDVNKTLNIEVLKEKAEIKDIMVENIGDDGTIQIAFEIKDVDETIGEPKLYVYDEKNNVVAEVIVEKNEFVNLVLDVNKNGIYTIKIKANEKGEEIELATEVKNSLKEIELFSTSIEVNNIDDLSLVEEQEVVQIYDLRNSLLRSTNTTNVGNVAGKVSESMKIATTIKSEKQGEKQDVLHVTVPTAAAFTVKSDSSFTAADIKVSNYGSQKIDVIISEFIDVTGNAEIELITNTDISTNRGNYERYKLNLKIEGNEKVVYLGSDRKLYSSIGGSPINDDEEKRIISKVKPGDTTELKLIGVAGNKNTPITRPIQDRFTMILKIRKSLDNNVNGGTP